MQRIFNGNKKSLLQGQTLNWLVGIASAAWVALSGVPVAAATAEPQPNKTANSYRTLGAGDYQSFIKNWDQQKSPALLAVIQTPAQWETIFHPAPVMGNRRPFSPDPKLFARDLLLVVARVVPPPDPGGQQVFKVEKVGASQGELTFSFRFAEPPNAKSYTVKEFLGVWVPKADFKKAVFIENGKELGLLDLAQGQWSVPPASGN
jgi:hypothetical protein